MRISIIGAGRVGQTLGHLAQQAGYEIGDVVCRSKRSATKAAKFIGGGHPGAAGEVQLLPADLVLVSTADDRIPEAVELIQNNVVRIGRCAVLHTSGALASDVLGSLRSTRISVGSFHPLQTFESAASALSFVPSSYFCIEGDARAVRAARRLVRDFGAHSFEVPTAMKGLYHAAAVMASGGVVALLSCSLAMLSRCGLSEGEARRVLFPLVDCTVANVRDFGPERALTGPVRRGDKGTVKNNLNALEAIDPKAAELYRLLAERSLTLVNERRMDPAVLLELSRIVTRRQ